jgi:hypothetical protein
VKWLNELPTLATLALIAGLAAGAYYLFRSGGPLGAGAPDPGGGAPASSALSAVLNQLEIGPSSLSYSDALQQTLGSPIQTLESILGWNSESSDTGDDND